VIGMPKIKHLKWKLLLTIVFLLLVAALYASPISCLFLHVFGIRCPGCGMTRALIAALQFDFKTAFSYHMMFWSIPLLYFCMLYDGKLFAEKYLNVILYSVLGLGFLVNWIIHL